MKKIVSILTVLAIVASLFLMAMPMTVSAEAVEFSGDASQIPEGKIVLTADIKGEFRKSSGKYEIDLNGHSWTHNGPAVYLTGTAELVIYNGTIDNSAGTSDGFSIEDNAKVTATNVTVIGGAGGADAFWIKGGNATITDCTISAGKAGIDVDNGNGNAVVLVNGGKFVNYTGGADARNCAIEIRRDGAISLTGNITFENNKILAGKTMNKTLGESISVKGAYEAKLANASVNNPGDANPNTYTTIDYKAVKVSKSIDYFNGARGSIADCTFAKGSQSSCTLLGWIITDAGLSNVKYAIDGGAPVELGPTRERPDVVAHVKYTGELVAANKVGIGLDAEHASIDISGLDVGEHVVTLYAYTNAGTQVEAGSFKVTITPPLAEGEIVNLSAIKDPGQYKLGADVQGSITLSSGDYVIDLNGHKWTNSGIALNARGANITITDSVGGGYIMVTANDCLDINAGSLTVTDATIIATADGMDAIFVGGGVVVTNNATLYAGKSGINASAANVDITVNGGTFGGVYSGDRFTRTAAFEFRNNAKVKLNGKIYFNEGAIIRRSANHTITWDESFILGEGATAFFDFDDTDIGVHSNNQYHSNFIYYTYKTPANVGFTPHSGHYGSPAMWLKNPNHYYEMIFNAEGDFNSITSSFWASNDGTTCTIDIYSWNSDRATTLAGEPVVSLTEELKGNPSNHVMEFETLYAGQYIVVIRCTKGYLVIPVSDQAATGAEFKVTTANETNLQGNKYWVATIRFEDSEYASFTTLLKDAGESEDAPLMIFDQEYNVTVGAGKTFYINAFWGGMNVTITGEGDFSVSYDGTTYESKNGKVTFTAAPSMGRMPTAFSITNKTNAAVEYSLKGEYPAGSMMNPEKYDDKADKTINIAEGNGEGYFYAFDADKDGSITLYISKITEGANGNITIQVISPDYTVKYLSLDENGVDGKLTADYKAGDQVVINVAVLPDASWNIPAATITLAEYTEGADTGDFGLIALAFVAVSSVVVKKRKEN